MTRTIGLLAVCALLLAACATDPIFRAGGSGGASRGTGSAGVGVRF